MPTKTTESTSDSDILTRDPELAPHLEALGLGSLQQYAEWCAEHGFSTRLKKHWRERCKERFFAAQNEIEGRLARRKQEQRKPRATIARILDGEIKPSELTQPRLVLIHKTAEAIADPGARIAFRRLLLTVQGCSKILTTERACPQLEPSDANTFIGGLASLARHHESWRHSLDGWQDRSRNAGRLFSSLARFLLAEYELPSFLDSVWFLSGEGAKRRQKWFIQLGAGASARRLDLPVALTKRMAHHFLQAPAHSTVDGALRFGQVLGLGGTTRLADAILNSRIGVDFARDEFWITVIRWLVRHPMFDPAQIGPLVDYLHHRRFAERGSVDVGTEDNESGGFSMKRRSPDSLLRQMRAWHGQLHQEAEQPQLEWTAADVKPLEFIDGDAENEKRWRIDELMSRKALVQEGQMMGHCVASYDQSCLAGGTSIWSVSVQRNGRRKRVLTIELANASKRICQIRGKANRLPTGKEMEVIRRWAAQEQLTVGGRWPELAQR